MARIKSSKISRFKNKVKEVLVDNLIYGIVHFLYKVTDIILRLIMFLLVFLTAYYLIKVQLFSALICCLIDWVLAEVFNKLY